MAKAILRDLRDRRALVATALIAVCVAWAGPFDTYSESSLGQRVSYWGLMVFASLPTSMTLRHVLSHFGFPEHSRYYPMLMVPLMAVIYGSFVWVVTHRFTGFHSDMIPAYPVMLLLVGLVTLVVVLARRMYFENAARNRDNLTAGQDPAAQVIAQAREAAMLGANLPDAMGTPGAEPHRADPPPRLMRRLPADAQGPVHRMEARDHFVRVVTPDATHVIRLRFADAVDEMDGVAGLCTHRSHWVRTASVVAAERDAARLFLCIADGARVPVSRGYRDRVEAAGLISPDMLAAASATERLAAQ